MRQLYACRCGAMPWRSVSSYTLRAARNSPLPMHTVISADCVACHETRALFGHLAETS